MKVFSAWCWRTKSIHPPLHTPSLYMQSCNSHELLQHVNTHSAHTWTHCPSTAFNTQFISPKHCFHSPSNAVAQGQDVDDNDDDDGVINPMSSSPSYPNNPQPSHTLAVKASDDIMSLSMIKLDAPYPIRQSRSISPMVRYGEVQYSRK